jgi:error-prone DNA polymerase
MAAWKRKGDAIARFGEKLIAGMRERGYSTDFAERCFEQIKGFSEYGFPESHAASFALLVYISSWLKCHYPAAFAAALINSQPMGFYQPAQIVRDAKEHGVEILPIDVNHSEWDCTLEAHARSSTASRSKALRLGMRLCTGLSEMHARSLVQERERGGAYASIEQLRRRVDVPVAALRRLARSDAYGSMQIDRQQALWAIQRLRDEALPLFDAVRDEADVNASLPTISLARALHDDLAATGLSLKSHPIALVREQLTKMSVVCARSLQDEQTFAHGSRVQIAGVVLVRQRPATASGVLFVTIEDETGTANLVVWPKTYEKFRSVLRHASAIRVHGTVERSGIVVHVVVHRARALQTLHESLPQRSRDFH